MSLAARRIPGPRLVCSGCGEQASCDCGEPLISKVEYARRYAAMNPTKSNRAIADEIHVGRKTVDRARSQVGQNGPPEKRTGKDRKQYPATQPQKIKHPLALPDPIQPECDGCTSDAERWQNSAGNMFADIISMGAYWDREFGKDWRNFHQPSALATLAKQAIEAFSILAKNFRS